MHRIDEVELCNTLRDIRAEAKALLADTGSEKRALGLRRIVMLLGYMAEHLEMIGGASRARPVQHPPRTRQWATPTTVREQ